jgi:wyosine [tRNA(Phe)-imidazoG37] synthetase (radical SAM superfamily)
MKYIFGPLASRRFGMSLGIDLSPDEKSCNFDCIYCELERAPKRETIGHPPAVDMVIAELQEAMEKFDYDVITITANGEPTLYPYLSELIDAINEIKGEKKLLILSNGSTIDKKEIRSTLAKLDIVKLSLDSANEKTFKKIDRPMSHIKLENIIDGLIQYSKESNNELILEILVVKGINDNAEEFRRLNEVIEQINPSRVDISTIDRPPAYSVEAVSYEKLYELSKEIKNQTLFIASRKSLAAKKESFSEDEIVATLKKRPFTKSDIETIFDEQSQERFQKLLAANKIVVVKVGNLDFYKAV